MRPGKSRRFVLLALEGEGFDRVDLGQHDLEGDGRVVEQVHHRAVAFLDLDAGVEQQDDAGERRAAAQVIEHQALPVALDGVAGLRVAVARHVDDREAAPEIEEVELAGAARRVGGPRERAPAGQRVDDRGLADIGAPREGDLGQVLLGELLEALRRVEEAAFAREKESPLLERARLLVVLLGGRGQLLATLARPRPGCCARPVWRMMYHCCSTVSVLFQQ